MSIASTARVAIPTSRVQLGTARVDITPPVGIYHRMWGAARHDRATGVHRPLFGDVLVIDSLEDPANRGGTRLVRAYLDMVSLAESQTSELTRALAAATGVPADHAVISYSHTHSGGWFVPNRFSLPGGELIPAYLEGLQESLARGGREALEARQPATISYALGKCGMAANRDYWDSASNGHVCGYNPDAPADDTLVVARMTDANGRLIATLVNYACHPTTLAWENSLLSPDYAGALRETVEANTQAPCIFAQGACGDLGPRHGFVGDPAVADQNGRQVGFAALATLASLGPPAMDFAYTGPVISGATLGVWAYAPPSAEHLVATTRLTGGCYTVDLPLKPRPDRAALEAELQEWESKQQAAGARGETVAARDFGARAERARRWLGRIAALPEGPTYPFPYSVFRVGDAIWATSGGEPYNLLQRELRQRFPDQTILFSPLAGAHAAAYLLPTDRYGKGLYQEEPSILAPGCLEKLIEAMAASIKDLS